MLGIHKFKPREKVLLYEDFNSLTGVTAAGVRGTTAGSDIPNGWLSTSTTDITMYGSTACSSMTSSKGWIFTTGTTGTQGSGAGGAMAMTSDGDHNISSEGQWVTAADGESPLPAALTSPGQNFMYYESSSGGASSTAIKRHPMRMAAIPAATVVNLNRITMSFWFHAFGAALGRTAGNGMGVACTTSATSPSSAGEAASGFGFTSDTAGGCTMEYIDDNGNLVSTVRLASGDGTPKSGQTHSSGGVLDDIHPTNYWKQARIDLSAAAGQNNDIYVWFGMFTSIASNLNISNGFSYFTNAGNSFNQDVCIDNILITGL